MENLTAYNELHQWVENNPNWDDGIILLKKHGKENLVATHLSKGQFPANKKLMLSTIRGLRDEFKPQNIVTVPGADNIPLQGDGGETTGGKTNPNQSPQTPTAPHPVFSLKAMYPNLELDTAPDFIKLMFADAIATWNRLCEAHDTELEAAENDEQRAEIMAKIIAADEENQAAHAELKHWNDTHGILGKHPKMAAITEENELKTLLEKEGVLAFSKKRENVYNNYSRYRKWCEDNPGHEKYAAKEKLRDKWAATLAICDKLLNPES